LYLVLKWKHYTQFYDENRKLRPVVSCLNMSSASRGCQLTSPPRWTSISTIQAVSDKQTFRFRSIATGNEYQWLLGLERRNKNGVADCDRPEDMRFWMTRTWFSEKSTARLFITITYSSMESSLTFGLNNLMSRQWNDSETIASRLWLWMDVHAVYLMCYNKFIILPVMSAIRPDHLTIAFALQRHDHLWWGFSKAEKCLTKEKTGKEGLDPEEIAGKVNIWNSWKIGFESMTQ
jgi:hypothetical protein